MKDNRAVRAAFLVILAVLAAVSVYQGIRNAVEFSQDLQWDASKALAMRLDPYELSMDQNRALDYPYLAEFYRLFTDKGLTQKMEANQFPSLLALLFPIAALPPYTARLVWIGLNIVFAAGIIFLLAKTFFEDTKPYEFAVIMLLMLAGTPFRNQLGVGQHTLFSFFFFLLAVYIDKKRPRRADITGSVLITLCLFISYFKYTLTGVLALYFLYRKRYKEIAVSVGVHVLLTGAAALWLKKSFMYMITAPLKVASALESEGGIDFGTFLGHAWPAAAAITVAVLLYAAIRMPKGMDRVLFAMLILWSMVIVYHRTYDMFVLSAAATAFIGDQGIKKCTDEKKSDILVCWYWVVIAAVYFGLRVFRENSFSMAVTGIIYYGLAIAITVCALVFGRG
ncbi:MAG: DUF2029 domain-containing protein [Lachnospiraceae bacterium]|nr:DUF2029 domain-containing protein [Lachnospiraceae bacterium]